MHTSGAINRTSPRAFSLSMKQRALGILLEYSASTGRKWQLICQEIMDRSSVAPSGKATLLIRQDLEKWANGSVPGDRKFARVYEFLTHPATLARPEFKDAANLLDPFENTLRVGRALAEFYSDFRGSLATPGFGPVDRRRAEAMCGTYVGYHRRKYVCLSVEQLDGDVHVARLLTSPHRFEEARGEWQGIVHSGYVTFGRPVIVHLRDVLLKETRTLSILASVEAHSLWIVSDEIVSAALERFKPAGLPPQEQKEMRMINADRYTFSVVRTDNVNVKLIIDNFR